MWIDSCNDVEHINRTSQKEKIYTSGTIERG